MLIRTGSNETWHQPPVTSFDDEKMLEEVLRSLVEETTTLLLSGLEEEIVCVPQFRLPSGQKIDLVGVNAAGDIVLVECKLAKNSQSKYEVVGQALAYAAGVSQRSVEEFYSELKARYADQTHSSLDDRVADWDLDAFHQGIASTIGSGRFRIVVAVDRVNTALSGIVDYLNAHTGSEFSVSAIELAYAADESFEILVPQLYGTTTAPSVSAATTAAKPWDVDAVLEEAESKAPGVAPGLIQLVEWCRSRPGVRFNAGVNRRVGISFLVGGKRTTALIIDARNEPNITLPFNWMLDAGVPREKLDVFLEAIAAVANGNLKSDVIASDFRKAPYVPAAQLVGTKQARDQLTSAVTSLLN
jgi:hypothetical protein